MLSRAWRWLAGEAAFMSVLAVLLVAFIYLFAQGHQWRRGVSIISVALVLAAILRMVLPDYRAGMLVVRGRWRDTSCYLVLGGVILVAAIRVR